MSVTERINKLQQLSEDKKSAEALEEVRKEAAMIVSDREKLKVCVDLLNKFGINQALVDINRDLLGNRGKITKNSGVNEGHYTKIGYDENNTSYEYDWQPRRMEARTSLEWFDNKSIDTEVNTDADDEAFHGYQVNFHMSRNTGFNFDKDLEVEVLSDQRYKTQYFHYVAANGDKEEYSTEGMVEICEDMLANISFELKEKGQYIPEIPKSREVSQPREVPQKKKRGFFGL